MPRPPKPVELHKQDGTYQKCRHSDRGTKLESLKELPCPSTLSSYAAEKWNSVIPDLCKADLVTETDIPLLEHAFYCYGLARDLRDIAKNFPGGEAAYISAQDRMHKDVVYESLRYMQEFEKIMYKFGMTPVERARIRGNKKPEEEEDSAIKGIIGNG